MLNGITITVVGMVTVFIFLGIMVTSMGALRRFVSRFLPEEGESGDAVAIAIAAAYEASCVASQRAQKQGHTS